MRKNSESSTRKTPSSSRMPPLRMSTVCRPVFIASMTTAHSLNARSCIARMIPSSNGYPTLLSHTGQIRIVAPLLADGGRVSVAGVDDGFVGKDQQFTLDRAEQLLLAAAGQVVSPYAAPEEDVADDGDAVSKKRHV